MAYSHPELVLVGAAQNLVLQTSASANLKGSFCSSASAQGDQDLEPGIEEYNALATW